MYDAFVYLITGTYTPAQIIDSMTVVDTANANNTIEAIEKTNSMLGMDILNVLDHLSDTVDVPKITEQVIKLS